MFKELYQAVKSGKEAARVIRVCGAKGYQERLAGELATMRDSEMWQAGAAVRSLRPHEKAKAIDKHTKGIAGRKA